MENYKQYTLDELKKAGAKIKNLRIRYYEKSPYQKNKYRNEFVFPEIWFSLKDKTKSKYSICINFEDFEKNIESGFFDAMIYDVVSLSKL